MHQNINNILAVFGLSPSLSVDTIVMGHLNQTYKVQTAEGCFILQSINTQVFPSVPKLMSNIQVYESERTLGLIACPEYLISQSDSYFWLEENGAAWRVYPWIEGRSLKKVSSQEQAYACGLAYGLFDASAVPVNKNKIQTVIPDFFNLASRLKALDQSLLHCHPERLKKIQAVLKEINALRTSFLEAALFGERHALPKRCMHGDTKPSNVLFDLKEDRAVGVIDLDTICIDYLYYDFGDGARSTANASSEEGSDAHIDLDLLSAFSQGFITPLKELITPQEILSFSETLPVFSYLLCVRFITDYCQNDRYFRVEDPEHNLRRALAQYRITQNLLHPDAKDCVRQSAHLA